MTSCVPFCANCPSSRPISLPTLVMLSICKPRSLASSSHSWNAAALMFKRTVPVLPFCACNTAFITVPVSRYSASSVEFVCCWLSNARLLTPPEASLSWSSPYCSRQSMPLVRSTCEVIQSSSSSRVACDITWLPAASSMIV
ncbi:hypothetical protein FQZ97_1025540 [compost metagenome]